MQIGNYRISECVVDHFSLDGGAMFGSVPKNLWSRAIGADDENRIDMVCRILVLDDGKRRILVDLGCGQKFNEKNRKIYKMSRTRSERLGELLPGVTDVILTHLHFDHVGGVSYYDGTDLKLNFPDALHYVQRSNWELAQAPGVRERATYLPENVEPLKQARLTLLDGESELLPQIFVHCSDGHTTGLQWLRITDGAQTAAFVSELVPTAHHLPLPYVMGYDMCASTTLRDKAALLERAEREGWWLILDHDKDTAVCKAKRDEKGRYFAAEAAKLPSAI